MNGLVSTEDLWSFLNRFTVPKDDDDNHLLNSKWSELFKRTKDCDKERTGALTDGHTDR